MKIAHLKITALAEQFRRAGIEFSRQPALIKLSELTEAQVKMIRAEPMIAVEDIDIDDGSTPAVDESAITASAVVTVAAEPVLPEPVLPEPVALEAVAAEVAAGQTGEASAEVAAKAPTPPTPPTPPKAKKTPKEKNAVKDQGTDRTSGETSGEGA